MNKTSQPESTAKSIAFGNKRAALAVALVATLATGGMTGAAVARSLFDDPATATEPRASHVDPAPSALGDTTLGELADELAAMGLEIVISPANEVAPVVGDAPAEGHEEDAHDPFVDMTDAEIDALSDEEFFALLESPLGSFAVNGDEIDTTTARPELAAQAEAIWERFVELIPAEQRQMVTGFELMSEEYGGAHVYATDEDPSKWVLGIGLGLGNDLDSTLLHEFGHLLTLQAKEVPPGGDAETCRTYNTGEGCALSGSTFAGFVQNFWPPAMIDEISRIEESGDWDAAESFYENNQDKFVTDYATTNPGEDLAETFAVFIMDDRPSGTTIADQKVQFLWNDPAMVALRDQIRANL